MCRRGCLKSLFIELLGDDRVLNKKIMQLVMFREMLDKLENEKLRAEIKRFRSVYREIILVNEYRLDFSRAQRSFIQELENITNQFGNKTMLWHKKELLYIIDEMLIYLQ